MDLRAQIGGIVAQLLYTPLEDDPNQVTRVPTFAYGRKSEINIQGDNMPFPAIILIEPDQFGFNLNPVTGNVRDTYQTFIQFVHQITEGEYANYRHPVVEAMRELAAQFIRKLSESDIFQDLPVDIRGILVIDTYDVNVVGIELNFPGLTDIQPRSC